MADEVISLLNHQLSLGEVEINDDVCVDAVGDVFEEPNDVPFGDEETEDFPNEKAEEVELAEIDFLLFPHQEQGEDGQSEVLDRSVEVLLLHALQLQLEDADRVVHSEPEILLIEEDLNCFVLH